MNRRNFLEAVLKAAAGFTILPPATTYSRIWRAERSSIPVLAPFDIAAFKSLVYEISRKRGQQENIEILTDELGVKWVNSMAHTYAQTYQSHERD